jgi:hypothetical protein
MGTERIDILVRDVLEVVRIERPSIGWLCLIR